METQQLLKKFGENIRLHRARLGLSQEDFAERCGLHRTYIGSIERGERNVALVNIVRIANALDVSIATLFEGINEV